MPATIDNDFVAYLLEQMAPLGNIAARKMFGGYGIFSDGIIFALVADDVLYMKVDEGNFQIFRDTGQPPFTYMKGTKRVSMSYYAAPDEAIEDQDQLIEIASQSISAAIRAKRSN